MTDIHQITIGEIKKYTDMKKAFKSIFWPIMAPLVLSLASCAEKMEQPGQEEPVIESTVKTCQMVFQGGVVGFDNEVKGAATKGTSSNWKDGDKIYIIFYNRTTKVPGEASYSTSGGWNVSYDGDLANGTNLKCEVRHFVNATFQSSSLVSLNENTEIYETTNGTYEYNGTTLTVAASMTPKTGRIRFNGTASSKIYLTGISVYTTYTPASNTFSSSNAMLTAIVSSTGATPYIYGGFADSDRKLGLVGSDFAFTRTCTPDVLKVGDSGYMAIPSESSHNNWRSGLYVKAKGIEFKMIPVSGLSSGFFMIGETEVTTALYDSVNGTSSTVQTPIDNISYSSIQTWIEKLNNATMLSFALPTSSQWLYAAKGGSQTQNYTYAGSNTPGDVAWYAANSTAKQNVKTKAPNELGIYDMSGNVAEFTTTMYDGTYPQFYGGCYRSKVEYVKKSSYSPTCYRANGAYTEWYYTYDDASSCPYSNSTCKASGIDFRLILICE